MGGRGAFFGKTNILNVHEFKTVLRIGKIRVIEPVNGGRSTKTPTLSRTARAIYATVRPDGKPKQITVYNKKREKLYDIDLDHDHTNGQFPNGHVQKYKNGKREEGTYYPLNDYQKKLVEQLMYGLVEAQYERGRT